MIFKRKNAFPLPGEVKSLIRYKLYIYVALLLLVGLYVFTSYQKSTDPKPDIKYLILEAIAITAIGALSSWYVNYFFLKHKTDHDIKEKEENNLRLKFSDFFGSSFKQENDLEEFQNTVIVLPSYHAIKNQDEEFRRVSEEITNDILEYQAKGEIGSRKSIKNFRESAAISFAQSDMIASTNIIAAYAKMGMTLPTIRTDVQGLIKFFQFRNKMNQEVARNIFENIKGYITAEEMLKIGGDAKMKEKILNSSNKVYTTYFAIGMYSNIFLMDLLNANDDNDLKDVLHFIIYNLFDENKNIVRSIAIRDNDEKLGQDLSLPMALKEYETDKDYGLVAKLHYKGRSIFIAAGVTVFGTECASLFLTENWEKIHEAVGNESFAFLIQLWRNENNSPATIIKKRPIKAFPQILYSLNSTKKKN